jgi:hypothetical protein
MGAKTDSSAGSSGGSPNRGWRRIALAGPISLLLHLVILVLARPEFSPVSDFAVEMEVIEMQPGEPGAQPPETPPEPEAEPDEPEPEEQAPEQEIAPDPEAEEPLVETGQLVESIPDAGVSTVSSVDAGAELASGTHPDGGTGEGSGICMHDLFPYGEEDTRWVLWLSLASFRGTAYQRDLGRTLRSFALYKKMAGAAGMVPEEEVEGLLVTARNVFDWRTFRVVATYDSGEERLRSRLIANRGAKRGFALTRTESGYEAAVPGTFRWHMVGSGRVLAVTHEPTGDRTAYRDPSAPLPPPPNPYDDPADASVELSATGVEVDGGARLPDSGVPPRPELPPSSFPEWPRQVTCMTRVDPAAATGVRDQPLGRLARSSLGPDDEGHWPVALLATRDPRAVGMYGETAIPVRFRYAVARAYFTDPIRIEGRIVFSGRAEEVALVEASWRKMIGAARVDPFLAMAGLRGVFEGLELESQGSEIRFTLPMTESQIQAALLFIQLQGEALERRTLRKEKKKPGRQPKS